MRNAAIATTCFALGCALLFLTGCAVEDAPGTEKVNSPQQKSEQQAAEPQGKRVKIGNNVQLEVLPNGKRRVLVDAYVCRRTDQLEQLLCRKFTKEHEAILAADVDARHIHTALLAAKAKAGGPVQYRPYKPAHGSTIKVSLQYKDDQGKVVTVPAQKWVRNMKTGKEMHYDWVFAGSQLFPSNQPGAEPFYAANDGDVICVSNFDTAMLDLPVQLPNENAELLFEAFTERIPPINTPVTVILEPVLEEKK